MVKKTWEGFFYVKAWYNSSDIVRYVYIHQDKYKQPKKLDKVKIDALIFSQNIMILKKDNARQMSNFSQKLLTFLNKKAFSNQDAFQ